MNYIAGDSVAITVVFEVEDNPQVPTADSVTYTLRDHNGDTISGQTNISVSTTDTDTQKTIDIDSTYTNISGDFENRTLVVKWDFEGSKFIDTIHFRLFPWLNYRLTEHSVRHKLGVDRHELPDEAIDIPTAYYEIQESLTQSVWESALAATTSTGIAAQNLLLLKTCINSLDSLVARLTSSESSMNKSFERIKGFNIEHIRTKLTKDYKQEELKVSGQSEETITSFTFTNTVDPLTGV